MKEKAFTTKIFDGNRQRMLEEFLKKGILVLEGKIDEDMFKFAFESIARLELSGSPGITIRINSSGGSCRYGFNIYDLIRLYSGRKKGIVIGTCCSMAFVALQACNERVAPKNALLLVHYGSNSFENGVLYDEIKLKNYLEDAKIYADRMFNTFLEKTSMSKERLHELFSKDSPIMPEQAKEFGFIDEII